jgi:hypothetical protein
MAASASGAGIDPSDMCNLVDADPEDGTTKADVDWTARAERVAIAENFMIIEF